MDRILVSAGTYEVGMDQPDWFNNPRRKITLTRPFEIGKYPITHGERTAFYREQAGRGEVYALMRTTDSGRRVALLPFGSQAELARRKISDLIPVDLVRVVPEPDTIFGAIRENQPRSRQPAVNWLYDELVAYANAHGGRLPTAVEWEVAARTAEGDPRLFDYSTQNGFLWDTPDGRFVEGAQRMADFGQAQLRDVRDVGSYPPNRRGIYDMTGGVWEYLDTFWGKVVDVSETVNPTGPRWGNERSIRGGAWFSKDEEYLCAANCDNRIVNSAEGRHNLGGRLAWDFLEHHEGTPAKHQKRDLSSSHRASFHRSTHYRSAQAKTLARPAHSRLARA